MNSVNIEFEPDSYIGTCRICGCDQVFTRQKLAIRETYPCTNCKASLREREHALAILDTYANCKASSIRDLASTDDFNELKIFEPGTAGMLRKFICHLPHYQQSVYMPEKESQVFKPNTSNIQHQDLEALTFEDNEFDLVITSDIMEHVRNPWIAFTEIHRVLKPGGHHIFTIPLQKPMPISTTPRVELGDNPEDDIYVLPKRYHGDGRGGKSIVYNDFGSDIVERLCSIGFNTKLIPSQAKSEIASRCVTLDSRKESQ